MNLIAAVDKQWGIGKNGDLLFRIPEDMKYFKDMTTGRVVVMGRKTLESLPGGKPLKDRTNIVLTENKKYQKDECTICTGLGQLFKELKKHDSKDIFVIGGAAIYDLLIEYCDKAYITKIDAVKKADSYLKNLDEAKCWKILSTSDEKIYDGLSFTFNVYKNKNAESII